MTAGNSVQNLTGYDGVVIPGHFPQLLPAATLNTTGFTIRIFLHSLVIVIGIRENYFNPVASKQIEEGKRLHQQEISVFGADRFRVEPRNRWEDNLEQQDSEFRRNPSLLPRMPPAGKDHHDALRVQLMEVADAARHHPVPEHLRLADMAEVVLVSSVNPIGRPDEIQIGVAYFGIDALGKQTPVVVRQGRKALPGNLLDDLPRCV